MLSIILSKMESKGNKVLELFFNEGTKHWHFREIAREAGISEDRANYWLGQFKKEKLIEHIKPKGKMPYFISNLEHPNYKNKKNIFALNMLYQSGLLGYLQSLEKAESVFIFGSFSRSDWYSDSDIDIFIYGDARGLDVGKYELKLHKDIHLFVCRNKNELGKLGHALIRNIIKGNLIKGDIPIEMIKNACI